MEEKRKIDFPLGSKIPHDEWDSFSADQQRIINKWFYEQFKQLNEQHEKDLSDARNEESTSMLFALIPLAVAYANRITKGELSIYFLANFAVAWIMYSFIVVIFQYFYISFYNLKEDRMGKVFYNILYALGAFFVTYMFFNR